MRRTQSTSTPARFTSSRQVHRFSVIAPSLLARSRRPCAIPLLDRHSAAAARTLNVGSVRRPRVHHVSKLVGEPRTVRGEDLQQVSSPSSSDCQCRRSLAQRDSRYAEAEPMRRASQPGEYASRSSISPGAHVELELVEVNVGVGGVGGSVVRGGSRALSRRRCRRRRIDALRWQIEPCRRFQDAATKAPAPAP